MIVDWRRVVVRLRPPDVAMYLRSRDWTRIGDYGNGLGSLWIYRNHNGEEAEILLPEDRELRDYVSRMSELIKTLEIVENRPAEAIVHDMLSITMR